MLSRFRFAVMLLAVTATAASATSAEWIVDVAAAAGGNGSAERPFQRIADGLQAMNGGDTVTVCQGTYRESLSMDKGGTRNQPSTLRAAEGQRVIISGFETIEGWTELRDGIYTTTVDGDVKNLYVGYVAQRIASSLDQPAAWADVRSSDQEAGRLVLDSLFSKLPSAATIAAHPANVCAFVFFQRANTYSIVPLLAVDASEDVLTVVDSKSIRGLGGKDRLTLCNHQALIDRPGEWACEAMGDRSKLYFMPASPDDLQYTQTISQPRALLSVGHWRDPQADFCIEGLELAGSQAAGIQMGKVTHATVANCILHNHRRNGLFVRNCQDIRIANCIAFANWTGLSVASSQNVVVEQNEVMANYMDGIVVAGDVSGRDAEPETHSVVVRGNYVHHHLLHGHPDNFQTYRGVHDIRYEDNLVVLAGQSLMTEETYGGKLINNVFLGAGARLIIFGHGNSHNWQVTNNTLGFGGWGGIGMDGERYIIASNIFLNNVLGRERDYTGDHNLLWNPDPAAEILRVVRPSWRGFTDVAPYAEQTQQDQHSRRADPLLMNVPVCQAVATDLDKCSADRLELRGGNAEGLFKLGEHIEINGDGVDRKVTETSDTHICFSPPLAVRPWRITLIWNWGERTDFALDFTPRPGSPANTMGLEPLHVGARLDAAAYRAGDFDGDGRRDLPIMADDLQAGIPLANDPVVLLELPRIVRRSAASAANTP